MRLTILLLTLLTLPTISLAQVESTGNKYRLEGINFGNNQIISAPVDNQPIIIDGPTATRIEHRAITISWTTDQPSSSIVSTRPAQTTLPLEEQGRSNEFVTKHLVTIIGLTPATTYELRVRSTNQSNESAESAFIQATTTRTAQIIDPFFSDITVSSFSLSFSTSTPTRATIRYGTDPTNLTGQIEDEATSFTTQHSRTVRELRLGATYFISISTLDQSGQTAQSELLTISTLPKPSVTSVRVSIESANKVLVNWKSNIETDSQVEYWTNSPRIIDGLSPGKHRTAGTTDKTRDHVVPISGLIGNTSYEGKIVGTDRFGNTVSSNVFSFTTPSDTKPPTIEAIRVRSVSSFGKETQAIISWSTDEPTTSLIKYGTHSLDQLQLQERTLNQSHVIILPRLSPSTSYRYVVVATDGAGNSTESSEQLFLSEPEHRGLLSLLIERLEETFGWLRRVF